MPRKLYKYRAFNVFCLRLLTHGEISYSDPRTFNDPLDCDPTIEVDIDRSALEHLCYAFLRSTKTEADAKAEIDNYRYLSTEYGDFKADPSVEDYLKRLLAAQIKRDLDQELGVSGVLSLSARWDSVLMWSHYADNHRGVCIEFDLTEGSYPNLRPVSYRAPRRIKASDLFGWKRRGSAEAEKRVRDTYYFAKAGAWKYEKEWRDIAPTSGPQSSNLRVTALHFGLQCDTSVMHAVVKLLDGNHDVELYDIYPRDDSFRLKRTPVDREEFESRGMRQPAWLEFKDLFLADKPSDPVEAGDPSG